MSKIKIIAAGIGLLCLFSCTNNEKAVLSLDYDGTAQRIVLSGEIEQDYQTRANDQGFCDGDMVGIYVVDYENGRAGELRDEGNRADNVIHTYDEKAYKWNSAFDIYWKDQRTNVDIYGYYPFASPEKVNQYLFSVEKDQSRSAGNGQMSGYEASDFLWGKAENIAPTDRVIRLGFKHRMASVRVSVIEGTGFGAGEWATMEKQALILNTKRDAVIDLATGVVTATGSVQNTGTIPYYHNGDLWEHSKSLKMLLV